MEAPQVRMVLIRIDGPVNHGSGASDAVRPVTPRTAPARDPAAERMSGDRARTMGHGDDTQGADAPL